MSSNSKIAQNTFSIFPPEFTINKKPMTQRQEENNIYCPKCGASQPATDICNNCGIVFAKFVGRKLNEKEKEPSPKEEQFTKNNIINTSQPDQIVSMSSWGKWNSGGRIIFIAACVASISMFMDWVSIGFASQSGLTQGTVLFLVFWVYPVLMLFKNKSISRVGGLICSIASIVSTIAYISSKSIELFGKSINVASTGAWLFLLVSIALIIGVIKYSPAMSIENKV